MKTNIEIEFKTQITEKQYRDLITLFDLENNIFKQTNYYFDTDDLQLDKQQTVLRIRARGDEHIKITLKSQSDLGAFEQHVLIDKNQASNMIESGFNVNEFFDKDLEVSFIESLDNYRVSTPYKNGVLFLDKCVYLGITDYEIEYEVDDYDEGIRDFKVFLDKHNIELKATNRKSARVLAHKKISL